MSRASNQVERWRVNVMKHVHEILLYKMLIHAHKRRVMLRFCANLPRFYERGRMHAPKEHAFR